MQQRKNCNYLGRQQGSWNKSVRNCINQVLGENLEKISELTSEYNVNFYQIILDTFGHDKKTKEKLLSEITHIDKIFNEFDKIYELKELKVF